MRSFQFVLITIFFLTACGVKEQSHANRNKPEDFDIFWQKFASEETFQLERIKFPLKGKWYDTDSGKDIDTLFIESEWVFSDVKDKKLHKTLKRKSTNKYIMNFQIDDTGYYVEYIFELIDMKWFLTSIIDEST